MGGPTVGILIRKKIDTRAHAVIENHIREVSSEVEDRNFWIEGRPFSHSFGEEYAGMLDELRGIDSKLGWHPADFIGLSAFCKDQKDHDLLGRLAMETGDFVSGVIDYGDKISHYTSDTDILKHEGVFEFDGTSFLTLPAFRKWLPHPDFRMVK